MPIIILVNSANVFELGELQNDDDIDAILWIGQPGGTGLKAVGQVLNGEVNPSGRTVDIYPADFKKDPTWYNAHTYAQYENIDPETGEVIGEAQYANNSIYNAEGEEAMGGNIVEYEDGIYLGYKYYETRAAEYSGAIESIGEEEYDSGEEWYDASVVYPFGYGLSYTTFSQ